MHLDIVITKVLLDVLLCVFLQLIPNSASCNHEPALPFFNGLSASGRKSELHKALQFTLLQNSEACECPAFCLWYPPTAAPPMSTGLLLSVQGAFSLL